MAPSSPLLLQGAEGQGRLLASRGVPAFAPDVAGLALGRIEGPGGRRLDRGVSPREPPSTADRRTGAVTVPAGVRGHPGAARHRPQDRPERRRGPLGIHHAPRRPLVSGLPPPLVLPVRRASACLEILPVPFADKGWKRRAVRPAYAPISSTGAHSAAAGTGAGGAQKGAKHPATRAPGMKE
jgi:hypothetical protein